MLKKLIDTTLLRRHYWRPGDIDELTEVYWSQMLRALSLGLVNVFVPVYLYRLGYDIPTIFWFYVWWFAFRPFLDIITGYIIARIGPKHTMVLGVAVQLMYLSLLLLLTEIPVPLPIVAILGGWAFGLFMLAMGVDFSKVKHKKHGGKELGYVTIFERAGTVIGPIVGGLVAGIFGAQYTIALAIFVLLGSLVPLFMSNEPVKTRQEISFESFPIRHFKRDFLSGSLVMLENAIQIILWPLFISVFIITTNTYTTLGFVAAIGTFGAVCTAFFVGKFTDKGYGGRILRVSVVGSSILDLLRPFVQSVGHILGINIVSEQFALGYRLPYTKAVYDRADSLPGRRIVYICMMSAFNTGTRFLFWLLLWALAQFLDVELVIKIGFFIGALASLGMLLERFPALNHNHKQA